MAKKKLSGKGPHYFVDKINIFMGNFFTRFFRDHREFWEYKKKYTELELRSFLIFFNNRLADMAIKNRDGVKIPEGLGHIYLGSIKTDRSVNNALSNKLGRNIPFSNIATGGRILKICYTNQKYNFEHRDMWSLLSDGTYFRPTASKAFVQNWPLYRNLEDLDARDKRQYDYYREQNESIEFVLRKKKNQNKI